MRELKSYWKSMEKNKTILGFAVFFTVALRVPARGVPIENKAQEHYESAVQEFLNGNDEKAVADLVEALQLNRSDLRAKKLLLKTSVKAVHAAAEKSDLD